MKRYFLFICLGMLLFKHVPLAQTGLDQKLKDIVDSTLSKSKRHVLDPQGVISIVLQADSSILVTLAAKNQGIRYIKYNPVLMKKLEREGNLNVMYALIAHEIGHHVLGHVSEGYALTNDYDQDYKDSIELAADKFAGKMLRSTFCFSTSESKMTYDYMDTFLNDEQKGLYPSFLTRKSFVIDGWYDEDKFWKDTMDIEPCEVQFALKARPAFIRENRRNKSDEPIARLMDGVMKISYTNTETEEKDTNYSIYMLKSKLAPDRYITHVFRSYDDNAVKLIWDYKKDGYSHNEIKNKSEWFGVAIYNSKFQPSHFPKAALISRIGGDVAALGIFALGRIVNKDAWDKYDDIYAKYTNPLATYPDPPYASVYDPPTLEGRENLRKEALTDRAFSYVLYAASAGAFYFCTRSIFKRCAQNRRHRTFEYIPVK